MSQTDFANAVTRPGITALGGTPEGLDALAISDLARAASPSILIHVARDDQRVRSLSDALGFYAPDIDVLRFPAWDCLPYDRVSPIAQIVARRMATLARLGDARPEGTPLILLTTVNGAIQKVPPPDVVCGREPFTIARWHGIHRYTAALLDGKRLYPDRYCCRSRRLRGSRRHHRHISAGRGTAGTA